MNNINKKKQTKNVNNINKKKQTKLFGGEIQNLGGEIPPPPPKALQKNTDEGYFNLSLSVVEKLLPKLGSSYKKPIAIWLHTWYFLPQPCNQALHLVTHLAFPTTTMQPGTPPGTDV